jgi:hypothetical protein
MIRKNCLILLDYDLKTELEYLVSDIRKQPVFSFALNHLETKENILRQAVKLVREKLSSQIAAIYLFSKQGNLQRVYFEGVDKEGRAISSYWLRNETYALGETFIGKATFPSSNGFGEKQWVKSFQDESNFSQENRKEYEEKLGSLNCGMAIPLDGQNKTYGVLVVINKVDKDRKLEGVCDFSEEKNFLLELLGENIASAISNWRLNKQKKLESELSVLLRQNDYSNSEKVYKNVFKRLLSDNTSFSACVLRVKNSDGFLGQEALDIVAKNEQERERLLKTRNKDPISQGYFILKRDAIC